MLTDFVAAVGLLFGHILDFPYSPVRLFSLMLSDGAGSAYANQVLAVAGLSYAIMLVTVGTFAGLLFLTRWPSHKKPFNVWVNLPTFDPTGGATLFSNSAKTLGLTLP